MQAPQPYLFTSPRMIALVDRAQMVPGEGPVADSIYGYHTFWAAEIPFIPASTGRSDRDFDREATKRMSQSFQRQVRFLYDLAQSQEHLSTFELRFVSWPSSREFSRVGIAFIGKTFHPNERLSRQLALALWNKFSAVFPREVPFSYPLVPVCEPSQACSLQTHTFEEWFEPIPFAHLTLPASIVELRKYEDWPLVRNIGGVYHAHDYIPHPFVPALDCSPLARLFETMAHQQELSIVAITIRPQKLTDQEELMLYEHAGWSEHIARGTDEQSNPLVDAMHELKNDVFEAYHRAYAEQGLKVYETLKRESHNLFTVRLQVAGEPTASSELVEALGSAVMANAGNAYPSRWSRVEANDEKELHWARFNLQWLEFARWAISPRIHQAPALMRLRQLATVTEVSGAFRLPVAPVSAPLSGLDVRDEPFVLPAPASRLPSNSQKPSIHLGNILDRGVPTGIACSLPVAAFSGFTHVFGKNGPARERVLHALLHTLSTEGIPWILLAGSQDTHIDLRNRPDVRHVRVDASQPGSGLEFHPLLPPPGISLATFLDTFTRMFVSIYALDEASGCLLRRAFMLAYEQAGWREQTIGQAIDLTNIAAQIEAVAQQTGVPANTANLLRTRCILPLYDTATTNPSLCSAPYARTNPWSTPTVVTFGYSGSESSQSLIRGSLWIWLALAMRGAGTANQTPRGIIALEEAHTLFSTAVHPSTPTSTSPLATPARAMASAGVGTLFVDDSPEALDAGICTNSNVIIITANSKGAAQEHTASFIGASSRQRIRMQHLAPSEAVVAVYDLPPVLVEI